MAGNSVTVRYGSKGAKQVTSEVDKLKGKLTGLQKQGAKGFITGVGAGAALGAFSLAGQAIQGVTRYLGDAADAFREDEVSVQKLNTALRANISGWNGNTKAIDERIVAGQKLGFSDEDQRSSLAELSAAYGDVTKSLDIMRIAEDLARFSGVDLATASDVLVKVHAGNFRALKALGIQTKGITNENQALAAVMKVVSGQAEDYAGTLSGKLAVAEEKAAEASEKFGKSIARLQSIVLPAVADEIGALADKFDFFQTALDDTATPLDKTRAALVALKSSREADTSAGRDAIRVLEANIAALEGATEAEKTHGDSLIGVRNAADDAIDELSLFPRVFGDIEATAKDAADAVDTFTDSVTDAMFSADIAAGKEQDLKDRITELKDELAGTTDKGDAIKLKGQIAELRQSLFELHLEEAEAEGPEAAIAFLESERKKAGAAKAQIDKLIQSYQILAGLIVKLPPILRAPVGRYEGKALPAFAEGGIVTKPTIAMIGEKGPEAVVPLGKGGGMGGGTINVNVTVAGGVLTPGGGAQLGQQLGPVIAKYLQDHGLLARARVF